MKKFTFIILKIENEYGSYYTCDKNYLTSLRDTFRQYLGNDVVYFTTGKLVELLFDFKLNQKMD